MSTKKPSLWTILSDTWRVITAHSRQFLPLSILFIFPNALAAVVYIFLTPIPNSDHFRSYSGESTPTYSGNSQLLIQIIYFLSIFIFSLCSVPSIAYTTFHGFQGDPINLISSLKSILLSFFPLVSTMLIVGTIMGLIVVGYIVLMVLSYNGLALVGFQMDYDSPYFLIFVSLLLALYVGLLLYLQIEWYVAYPVVVLESKWGFAPLKRSSYLVRGMRGVVFLIKMLLGVLSVVLSVWILNVVGNARRVDRGSSIGWVVVQMVVFVGLSVPLTLYGLAANTVVYVHCKALHQEMELRNDDGSGVVYVRLPSDVDVV